MSELGAKTLNSWLKQKGRWALSKCYTATARVAFTILAAQPFSTENSGTG